MKSEEKGGGWLCRSHCHTKWFELLLLFFPVGLRFTGRADLNADGPTVVKWWGMVGVFLGPCVQIVFPARDGGISLEELLITYFHLVKSVRN